jgi:hypothetical protein
MKNTQRNIYGGVASREAAAQASFLKMMPVSTINRALNSESKEIAMVGECLS